MKLSKRTVLWIIPLLIIGVFYYFYGPKDEITDNEYIDFVKKQSLVENSELTAEQALNNYCKNSSWIFFKTQRGQSVVEFKGECPVEKKVKPINLQIMVNDDNNKQTLGVLLIDNIQQTSEKRDQYLQTVYAK